MTNFLRSTRTTSAYLSGPSKNIKERKKRRFSEKKTHEEQQVELEYTDSYEDNFIKIKSSENQELTFTAEEEQEFEDFNEKFSDTTENQEYLEEVEILSEHDQMEFPENMINCRICRQSAEVLRPIFEILEDEHFTVADMMEFTFSVKVKYFS